MSGKVRLPGNLRRWKPWPMRQILPFSSQVAPVQRTARAQVFEQPTFRANAACSRVAWDDRAVQETFGPFTFFFCPIAEISLTCSVLLTLPIPLGGVFIYKPIENLALAYSWTKFLCMKTPARHQTAVSPHTSTVLGLALYPGCTHPACQKRLCPP